MTYLGAVFLFFGIFFQLVGSVGVLRLPDFYSRLHATSKPDTLGIGLSMLGLAIYQGFDLSSFKLLLGALFVFLANPAAAHALGRSAMRVGVKLWVRPRAKEKAN